MKSKLFFLLLCFIITGYCSNAFCADYEDIPDCTEPIFKFDSPLPEQTLYYNEPIFLIISYDFKYVTSSYWNNPISYMEGTTDGYDIWHKMYPMFNTNLPVTTESLVKKQLTIAVKLTFKDGTTCKISSKHKVLAIPETETIDLNNLGNSFTSYTIEGVEHTFKLLRQCKHLMVDQKILSHQNIIKIGNGFWRFDAQLCKFISTGASNICKPNISSKFKKVFSSSQQKLTYFKDPWKTAIYIAFQISEEKQHDEFGEYEGASFRRFVSYNDGESWEYAENLKSPTVLNSANNNIGYYFDYNDSNLYKCVKGENKCTYLYDFGAKKVIKDLTTDSMNENEIFAIVSDAGDPYAFGVYVSENGGANFKFKNVSILEEEKKFIKNRVLHSIRQDPLNPRNICFSTEGSEYDKIGSAKYLLVCSYDRGKTWNGVGNTNILWHSPFLETIPNAQGTASLWLYPTESNILYLFDGGHTWSKIVELENGSFAGGYFIDPDDKWTHIAFTPTISNESLLYYSQFKGMLYPEASTWKSIGLTVGKKTESSAIFGKDLYYLIEDESCGGIYKVYDIFNYLKSLGPIS